MNSLSLSIYPYQQSRGGHQYQCGGGRDTGPCTAPGHGARVTAAEEDTLPLLVLVLVLGLVLVLVLVLGLGLVLETASCAQQTLHYPPRSARPRPSHPALAHTTFHSQVVWSRETNKAEITVVGKPTLCSIVAL